LRRYQDQSVTAFPPQSVLSVHNFYRQSGGEDRVFADESALLESHGHTVIRFEDRNSRIAGGAAAAVRGIWNQESSARLGGVIRKHRPDVAHFHNTFPLISPASYYAARRNGVPVVQTLHNFRLLCPAATFFRQGHVCEECLGSSSLWPAIAHGCYRDSRPASAAVASMLVLHRAAGTWQRMVDLYIAPSDFVRQKFVDNGFSADRIVVKPNVVLPDPGPGEGSGNYALFVGRLSEEKGVRTLAAAWQKLADIPLLVAGDGPLSQIRWPAGVTPLGPQPRKDVLRLMQFARVLIFPSVWYEGQPMTILESFACGLPVIGSELGSIRELIDHHRTGLLFRPDQPEDLASKVRWAFEHPEQLTAMRVAARREFEEKYTAGRNYKMLIDIYDRAIEIRAAQSAGRHTHAAAHA
jgi:glycosyltransferase involved in cell wall biosynthesis